MASGSARQFLRSDSTKHLPGEDYPYDPPQGGCDVRLFSAESFEEIGFARATAIHETERAIKLLCSPDRLVVLVG